MNGICGLMPNVAVAINGSELVAAIIDLDALDSPAALFGFPLQLLARFPVGNRIRAVDIRMDRIAENQGRQRHACTR